jgi:hypothetical protein
MLATIPTMTETNTLKRVAICSPPPLWRSPTASKYYHSLTLHARQGRVSNPREEESFSSITEKNVDIARCFEYTGIRGEFYEAT